MPKNSFLCPLGISFEKGQVPFYARWASFFDRLCLLIRIGQVPFYARWASFFDRLCLALPDFAWLCLALPGFDTGNTPNYMIMTFL